MAKNSLAIILGAIVLGAMVVATGSAAVAADDAAPRAQDRTIKPESYGAAHSVAVIHCNLTAGSNRIACPGGTGDFAVGQGLDVPDAGNPSPVPAPQELHARVIGAAGTTPYAYALCSADPWKGIAGCAQARVVNGPADLSLVDYVAIDYARNLPHAGLWLLYRRKGGEPWRFVTTLDGYPYKDLGWVQPGSAGWPVGPPAAPVRQDFFSAITAVEPNALVVADAVPATLAGATLKHDDTLAVQTAYDTCIGGTVAFGPYHYRLVRPSVWNFQTRRFYYGYTAATPGYPDLYPQGVIHVSSGCTTTGAGRHRTVLTTDFMSTQNGAFAVFEFVTGTHSGLNDPASYKARSYPIAAAAPGAQSVKLLAASDARHFATGDYVLIRGGTPIAGATNASSEINRVVSSDPSHGTIALAAPLEKPVPLGAVGVAPQIVNIAGDVVANLAFSRLTIETFSSAFGNVSAVYHAHMEDLDLPLISNGQFWYGGYRRDWSNRDVAIAGTTDQEIDLDEDVLWQGGSCYSITGRCFAVTEASSNVRIRDAELKGETRLRNEGAVVAVQGNIGGFELSGSRLVANCSASNLEEFAAVVVAGGILPDYVPRGLTIARNRIATNCRGAISVASAFDGLDIAGNRIALRPAKNAPWSAISLVGGVIRDNRIEITPPGNPERNCAVRAAPGGGSAQAVPHYPLTMTANQIKIIGHAAHCGIFIRHPRVPYDGKVAIARNRFERVSTAIVIENGVPKTAVTARANVCVSCADDKR